MLGCHCQNRIRGIFNLDITIKQAEDIFFKEIEKFPYYYSIACTGEHVSILPMPKHQAEIVNPFILKYD